MEKNLDWSEDESSGEWLGNESESERSEDETPTESDIEFIDDTELSEETYDELSEDE